MAFKCFGTLGRNPRSSVADLGKSFWRKAHSYIDLRNLESHVYAKNVDPDQTAPKEQSDQGLHSLPIAFNEGSPDKTVDLSMPEN